MTTRKYKSVEEIPGRSALRPLDQDNLRVACELTELAFGIRSWKLEPGIRKFRSVEQASSHRRDRERHRVREIG